MKKLDGKTAGGRGGTLYAFEKGETGNPKGRPRKFVIQAQTEGYKLSEVSDTLEKMLAMNLKELKSTFENKDCTMLEKIVAAALRNAAMRGQFWVVEQILERLYGKTSNVNIGHGLPNPKELFPTDESYDKYKEYLRARNPANSADIQQGKSPGKKS